MAELRNLKNLSERDRNMLEEAEQMLGPEPSEMGFVKNLFWGNLRRQMVHPYPKVDDDEKARCDAMLARLDDYLKNEHPAVQIDKEEEIPRCRPAMRIRIRPGCKLAVIGALSLTAQAHEGSGGPPGSGPR